MFGQAGDMAEIPWGEVGAAVGWSGLAASVTPVVYLLLMGITVRRSLLGGTLEARLLAVLLRNGWFLAIVLLAPVIAAFRSWNPAVGSLLAAAAMIFVLLAIPPINRFFRDLAVVGRLGQHFWNHRFEIERSQSRLSAEKRGEGTDQPLQAEAGEEPNLGEADRQLRKKIGERLYVVQFSEKVLFRTGYEWDNILEAAGREAGPGLLEYTSMMASGRYSSIPSGSPLAPVGTFLLLLLWTLAGSLTWSAWRMAQKTRLDVGISLGIGLALGSAALAFPPLLRGWRRSRWEFPCLVCEKRTRRRIPIGSARPHLCGEVCEKTLKRLYQGTQIETA